MGRTVRGMSHGVALPEYIADLSGKERRNAIARWKEARRQGTEGYRCRRCGADQPYAAFPLIRVLQRESGRVSHRRAVICATCARVQEKAYPPYWERMTPEARAQAERVRAWVAGEWGEEPAWLDNHRAANSEAREGRVTVAAILSTCHGWGPTRTGHAIGCDHSTVLHHLGKLADGRYPDVADMVADYRREHRRARKAG